jgi:hypothetical protein
MLGIDQKCEVSAVPFSLVVTDAVLPEGIVQALASIGPVPVTHLQLLQDKLNLAAIGNDGKTLLKNRLLQVAKVEMVDGVKCMVLK